MLKLVAMSFLMSKHCEAFSFNYNCTALCTKEAKKKKNRKDNETVIFHRCINRFVILICIQIKKI